eukprot:scaffold647_cov411-Prasinococcus_capsulatus_cf.AAC.7
MSRFAFDVWLALNQYLFRKEYYQPHAIDGTLTTSSLQGRAVTKRGCQPAADQGYEGKYLPLPSAELVRQCQVCLGVCLRASAEEANIVGFIASVGLSGPGARASAVAKFWCRSVRPDEVFLPALNRAVTGATRRRADLASTAPWSLGPTGGRRHRAQHRTVRGEPPRREGAPTRRKMRRAQSERSTAHIGGVSTRSPPPCWWQLGAELKHYGRERRGARNRSPRVLKKERPDRVELIGLAGDSHEVGLTCTGRHADFQRSPAPCPCYAEGHSVALRLQPVFQEKWLETASNIPNGAALGCWESHRPGVFLSPRVSHSRSNGRGRQSSGLSCQQRAPDHGSHGRRPQARPNASPSETGAAGSTLIPRPPAHKASICPWSGLIAKTYLYLQRWLADVCSLNRVLRTLSG